MNLARLLALTAGVFSVSYFPQLPSWPLLLLLTILVVLLLFLRGYVIALFIAGVLYGCVWGGWLLSRQLPAALEGEPLMVTGHVVNLPQREARKVRFRLRIDDAYLEDSTRSAPMPTDSLRGEVIQLVWYLPASDFSYEPVVKPGQYWQFQVKLRRPRGLVNPGGFDYQLYLLQQRIVASGYVYQKTSPRMLGDDCWSAWLSCLRESLKHRLFSTTQHAVNQGLLAALLVGDRQLISTEQWGLLRDTGTVHLLAISGLHIGLAAWVGAMLGVLINRLCQLYSATSHHRWLVPVCAWLLAVVYSLMAGLTLPTQRALIMISVYCIYSLCSQRPRPLVGLAVAALLVAVVDPLAVRSASFWLSFLAVSVLLLAFCGRRDNSDLRRGWFRVLRYPMAVLKAQWVVSVGLLLPGLLLLQGVSGSAFLANMFAVPWVSVVTVPLLLLAVPVSFLSPSLAGLLWAFADKSLTVLVQFLQWLADMAPGFIWLSVADRPWWVMVISVLGVIWLLLPRGLGSRWLGLLCLLPVLWFPKSESALTVTFLDVGQGTAVVVEAQNHVLVYDVGRRFSERFDSGEHIVAPFLRSQGIQSVDRLMISHGDSDHAGGVAGFLSMMPVTSIYSGQPDKTGGQQCVAGQRWQWGDVAFNVLWPTRESLDRGLSSSNNYSCVLYIATDNHSVLLVGDIESSVEGELLSLSDFPQSVDVVLASHHGSKSSSSIQWLQTLQPDIAIITSGYHNRYGHPHQSVIERFQQLDIDVLNTATSGAVVLHSELSGGWQVVGWRDYDRRYWYETLH